MNIDTLKAEIAAARGLAAANRFSIQWPVVRGIAPLFEETTVFCQTVSLPGRTIQTQEFQNQDVMTSFPFVYDDGDVSLTFILTNDYFLYDFFIEWMGKVIDTSRYIAGYAEDYKVDMTLIHDDKMNSAIKKFKILNCWPKSITPIELSTTNENQFSIFTVTLSFKRFEFAK